MIPNKENAMLVDVQYVKANKKAGEPDILYMIWKDLDTGEKYVMKKKEPTMNIYFTKPEKRTHDYNKNYEFLDNVTEKTVKYKDIPFEIANDMGDEGKAILNNIFNTRRYGDLNKFNMYPYVYGSDIDVRTYYRAKWNLAYDNDRMKKLAKGFLDIEADGILHEGFVVPETCPVNAVTILDDKNKTSYTFALTGRKYPERDLDRLNPREQRRELYLRELFEGQRVQIEALKEDVPGFINELHETFDDVYGDIDYKVFFYEDEAKMLVHIFQLVNKLKLDIIGIWNMPFDIPYLMDRMRALGLDPAQVMCHPDFPIKQCYFKKDNRNFNIKDKTDYFNLSSYTLFCDQMTIYAALRKGQQELRSNKLGFVARKELNDDKLDYGEEGNIKYFPYLNFRKFLIYNIKDVLLQYGVERKVNDFDEYYLITYRNNVGFDGAFKQTIVIRAVQYSSFLKQKLITGNNINIFNYQEKAKLLDDEDEDDDEITFEGALVAHPIFYAYMGEYLYGRRSNNIIKYSIDMDMGAFYPSSIIGCNIDPSTLIFKMIMYRATFTTGGYKMKQYILEENENKITDPKQKEVRLDNDDLGKDAIDNYQTGNVLSTGYKWLNLPSVDKVYKKLQKKLG